MAAIQDFPDDVSRLCSTSQSLHKVVLAVSNFSVSGNLGRGRGDILLKFHKAVVLLLALFQTIRQNVYSCQQVYTICLVDK